MERREILADTSGIIALLDEDDQYHAQAIEAIRNQSILIPVTILPEVDYLATKYLGEQVARAFLDDLRQGEYQLVSFSLDDLTKTIPLMERYRDLPLGFVDASLAVLAERLKLSRILTLDHRHFNLLQTSDLPYLILLPNS